MGDLESLFLVLLLVYSTECLTWLRRGVVVFRTLGWRTWRVVTPLMLLTRQQSGPVWGNPLPPLGTLFPCAPWVIAFAPEAICASVTAGGGPAEQVLHAGPAVPFATIRHVTTEAKDVLINETLFVKADSVLLARRLADLVHRLAALPVMERQAAITALLASSVNATAVIRLVEAYQWHTAVLRWLENALFVVMFIALPVGLWRAGFSRSWLWLVLGLVVLMGMTLSEYYRAHKALYPWARGERLTYLAIMLLSPPMAMRAHDLLAQHLFDGYHPLVVAQVLCPPQLFRALAQRVWRDLCFPLPTQAVVEDAGQQATVQWFRMQLTEALARFLSTVELSSETLLAPPARDHETSRTYCPRCHCQYTVATGTCSDCPGVSLLSFA